MNDAASQQQAPPDAHGARGGAGRAVRAIACVLAACALVGVAAWLVGPAPRAADSGLPKTPPPLALPSDVADDAPIARAAALLAAGRLDEANRRFVDVVAEDQASVAGQVGLVLTRWRSTGPRSVERDLVQLTKEYPDSALAALHLGLVQTLLGESRQARATLREAVELGRAGADPTSLRMARLADDLLHPGAFRGPLPVLVQPAEVAPSDRAALRRLLAAVSSGDRDVVASSAAGLLRSPDHLVRVAAISATFDKDDPRATVERLDALAADAAEPRPARERAAMLAALAVLWPGDAREDGCARLAVSAQAPTGAATRRLATPVHAELCTSPH